MIREGKIADVLPGDQGVPADCLTIDAAGARVVPGLIDTHVCGAVGMDCRQGSEAIKAIAGRLVEHGVTSWLPTPYAVPIANMGKTVAAIAEAMAGNNAGARVLGVHLEGPYFSAVQRGIARQEDLCAVDLDANRAFLAEYGDLMSMVTLSPEMEGITPLIRQFATSGVVVAAGHTAATKAQIMRARDAGLTHVTHIFNAMGGRRRVQTGGMEPGTSDFCLLDDSLTASVIGDGVHVWPDLVRLVLRTKGIPNLVGISDLWPGAGWPVGTEMTYVTGEDVIIAEDAMRMKSDHRLAGATTFLNQGAHNFMKFADLTWPQAVQLCCLNPARLLGMDKKKGDIRVGMDADLAIVDESWTPQAVLVNGTLAHTVSR